MATYYVDGGVGASGNGLTLGTAKKTIAEGVALLAAGDRLEIVGGEDRVYRETMTIGASKSGASSSARTRVTAHDPAVPFIISGGVPITGWTACDASDEAVVGPNYASLYKKSLAKSLFPSSNILAANLCESGVQMPICTSRANETDTFFITKPDYYHLADAVVRSGTTITGFTKPSLFASFNQTNLAARLMNATVLYIKSPNVAGTGAITAYDAGTGTISTSGGGTYQSSGQGNYFALRNFLPNIRKGEWGYVDNGTTATIYVWPNAVASVAGGLIQYSSLPIGINLLGASHVEVDHFEVRQMGQTTTDHAGIIARNNTFRSDLYLHDFYVHDGINAGSGSLSTYGMIFIQGVHDLTMTNWRILRAQGMQGVFLQGFNSDQANNTQTTFNGALPYGGYGGRPDLVNPMLRTYVSDYEVGYCTMTATVGYVLKDFVFAFGRVYETGKGAHANKIQFYEQCHNGLFWGLNYQYADGYATWQEMTGVVMGFCAWSASTEPTAGGARGIESQQKSKVPVQNATTGVWSLFSRVPGDVHGYPPIYVFNCRVVPDPAKLTRFNSMKICSANDVETLGYAYNNIYHGVGTVTGSAQHEYWASVVDHSYGISTNSTVPPAGKGTNNDLVPYGTLYTNPAAGDFSYPANSPVRTKTARDMRDIIDAPTTGLAARFPQFTGWNLDMNRQAIDWSDAPMGPTVNLDADYSVGLVPNPVPPWAARGGLKLKLTVA